LCLPTGVVVVVGMAEESMLTEALDISSVVNNKVTITIIIVIVPHHSVSWSCVAA
jgi:hypothetical protein